MAFNAIMADLARCLPAACEGGWQDAHGPAHNEHRDCRGWPNYIKLSSDQRKWNERQRQHRPAIPLQFGHTDVLWHRRHGGSGGLVEFELAIQVRQGNGWGSGRQAYTMRIFTP